MSWYAMYENAQQRATEMAHLNEQEFMYARIVASAERSARRFARRHEMRVRLAALAHLPAAQEHLERHRAQNCSLPAES
jgi:hypothetical protein